jgi:ZIP family zinc transporter
VATSLLQERYSRRSALLVAGLTGLVEPLGAALGWVATALAAAMLPLGLAFAAGAMLYVVSGEVIPESQGRGGEDRDLGDDGGGRPDDGRRCARRVTRRGWPRVELTPSHRGLTQLT